MTPRRDNYGDGEDEDLRAYEVDGWRIGYEVEMNGVGFVEDSGSGTDDDSSFSDSENESVVDSDQTTEASPYAEYRTLPMQVEEPAENSVCSEEDSENSRVSFGSSNSSALQSTSTSTAVVSPPIRKEFEKLLQDNSMSSRTSPDEVIPHQPTNITLDAGMSRKREHAVDCEMAKRGVWLVKVPRYLSDLWEANAGTDVGRLVIHHGANGKGDVSCFRTFRFGSFIVEEFFLCYNPRFLVR
ncbi:hypothetical protein ANCCAN_16877 [Ancylostoma caninum]|uniref:TFIIF beta subunit N-terminal domain-containing protein n=1 Tax=Ancylostoma caninum TaxID=29170 RepID=A0A368FYG0_ANCCA|nr:hypothetical protein ANCCAN_16877 [Ancylostoma caninum]